ncbi:MAG: OadG family protein [Campylobacterota bacterium]|nr:OadG family protein [Campylobacterota bacterium]
METNLVLEGFKFMGLGMGTVFLFLVIMIISMNIMSIVVHKFFPEPEVNVGSSSTPTKKDNNSVVAAITAAIKHHREG